jgi:alpha-1,3-mannosyltransferase
MRITHVVRQFQPAVGGIENVVLALASAQVRAGHAVRVVTLDRLFFAPQTPRLPARENIQNIDVVRIPYVGSTRYPIAPSVINHLGKADIVHVHAIDFFFDYLAWTKLIHRKMLVVSTHGGFFHTSYMARLKRLYFATITRQSARFYEAMIVCSRSDEELFERIRPRRIVFIENGVDIAKYANASSKTPRKAIISHGRLSSNKRLDRLIALVARLRRIDGGWTLKIAGRPWDVSTQDLAAACQREKVSEAVEITLSPSDEKLRALMGACSIAASASEYEGFGLSAVEGMSAGLLPVLSSIPPFRALVARTGCGIVIDFDDPETAAQQVLNAWHGFCDDYDTTRQALMKATADYDWQHAAAAYEELYSDIVGKTDRNDSSTTGAY